MDIDETLLPGIGVRHDFVTRQDRRVGVISHRTGLRELLVYDRADPDACRASVLLSSEEAETLARLLGAPRIIEHFADLHRRAGGLVSEWVQVAAGSSAAERTLAESELRSRTGVSVVAVVRHEDVVPAPAPQFRLKVGDIVVLVGTVDGLGQATSLLSG